MEKKKFYVVITTTFKVEEPITAESEEQALKIAEEMVNEGEIDTTETLDFETTFDVWKGGINNVSSRYDH